MLEELAEPTVVEGPVVVVGLEVEGAEVVEVVCDEEVVDPLS